MAATVVISAYSLITRLLSGDSDITLNTDETKSTSTITVLKEGDSELQ